MKVSNSYNLETFQGLEAAVQDAHDDWLQGDFQSSFGKYLAIVAGRLAIAERSQLPAIAAFGAADLVVIERLADLARLFGKLEAASDLLQALTVLCHQSGNLFSADYMLLKRIDLLLGFGKLDESEKLLEQMSPRIGSIHDLTFQREALQAWESSCQWPHTHEQERAVIFSLLYLVLGRIFYGSGQYADAIASFRRGLAHTKRFKADLSIHLELQLSLSLAASYLDMGDMPAAEKRLLTLEPLARTAHEPWPLVRWLEISAKLNQLSGRLGQARDALADVYNLCGQCNFHRAQLGAAMNLAHILILMNQTVRANEILQETMKVAEHIGEDSQAKRFAFLIDILQARMRSLVESVPVAPSVSEMHSGLGNRRTHLEPQITQIDLPPSDNYMATFEDRVLEFHRYLGFSDLARADLMAMTTISDFQLSDSKLIHTRLQVMKAVLAYYKGELELAERVFVDCKARLKHLGLIPELWQAQRFLGWCWIRLRRPEEQIAQLTSETEKLLQQITSDLSTEDEMLFLLNKWTTEEEFIAGKVNQLSDLKKEVQSLPFFSRWRQRSLLMDELDALCLHLESYKTRHAKRLVEGKQNVAQTAPQLRSFWRRLWGHSLRRCSVQFLVLPDRVLIISRRWLSIDFGVSSVTRIHLRELIRSWHGLISMRMSQSSSKRNLRPPKAKSLVDPREIAQRCEKIAQEVADILQLPSLMKVLPKRIRALTFAPDDVLHGLPFAALKCNGRYLVERFAVTTSFGNENLRSADQKLNREKALVVHVARGSRQHDIKPLPGTESESESIKQWLSRRGLTVQELHDDTATKSAILQRLSDCSVFHIACHGQFVSNRTDLSGLILLPTAEQMELLSFVDLSKLDLSGVQHATLSSCWSADNFILPGRWIISLPETLSRAGVHSVLASFWQVEDQLAISFMERFFEYLNKHSREVALRLTQLDCLNRTLFQHNARHRTTDSQSRPASHIDTSDPFYWANYALHGEHKKLTLPR